MESKLVLVGYLLFVSYLDYLIALFLRGRLRGSIEDLLPKLHVLLSVFQDLEVLLLLELPSICRLELVFLLSLIPLLDQTHCVLIVELKHFVRGYLRLQHVV